MSNRVEFTQDGWLTDDLRAYRLITDHAPLRPWGYGDQIRTDCREPKVVRIWVTGGGATVAAAGLFALAGVLEELWPLYLGFILLGWGVPRLFVWVYGLRVVVTAIRTYPASYGVLEGFRPHPKIPGLIMIGTVRRENGEMLDVSAEETFAKEVERAGVPAEVKFLKDPKSDFQFLIAARPIRHGTG